MFKPIKDNLTIIRDFFRLVKGSKIWVFLIFLGSIMAHTLNFLIPFFAANIIYEVTNGNASGTYINIVLWAVFYTVYNLSWYLNYVAYSHNFKYSYRYLREKILDKVFTYDLEFSDKIPKGNILNTINTDVANLSEMIDCVCEIMVVFVKVIVMIFVFLFMNVYIGLFVLLLEFIYLKSSDYCNTMGRKHLHGQYKYRDKLTDDFSQVLNGLEEIKVFNIHEKVKRNFNILIGRWSSQYMAKRKYMNIKDSLLPFINLFGRIVLYTVLAWFVLKGKFEVNTLILMISYFGTLMTDSTELMEYSRKIREWSVSIERVNNILNYSGDQKIRLGKNENDYIDGLIEFKNVNFAYKSKNKGNVKDISFKALPNQITALVGHSGSGKTTITNLIFRRYKIDSGEILIDGENIYNYSKDVYSKNIVGVNQSPFVFNMSIRQNLSLVDPNRKNQEEACKRVGLHKYIMSLPKGYNTVLTEDALNFSGGQKQLLAIARTLLSKAEILVFDEVTSSLDPLSAGKIMEVLDDLRVDHTILIVTHKKEIMKMADKIVVLKDGEIVGEGSHSKLMKSSAYYKDLQTKNYSSSHKEMHAIVKQE